MSPKIKSSTDTLYSGPLQYSRIRDIGTHQIQEGPTRFVQMTVVSGGSSASVAIHDGLTTGGELVGRLSIGANLTMGKANRTFDVALSGGLTIDIALFPVELVVTYA